jgi:hypothetical protein
MKKVAVVNGMARQYKYNKVLAGKYERMGCKVEEFYCSPMYLFFRHLRFRLDSYVKNIVENHDIIHCQSGGFISPFEYYVKTKSDKPFIIETPVFNPTTGAFLTSTNVVKSHHGVKENFIIRNGLDFLCFPPEWRKHILKHVVELKNKNQLLVLASEADAVADIRGQEEYFSHIFKEGRHARLFYDLDGVNNDFGVIEKFILNHKYFQK